MLSVLNTIFIPYVPVTGMFDINMSALFAREEVSNKLEGEILIEDEDLDWIFSKQKIGVFEGNNTVKLNGNLIDNQKVKKTFINAFRCSAEIIISNKLEFLNLLKKLFVEREYKIRQVLRPTQVYHRYIEISQRPELLSNHEKFNHIFDSFINNFEPSNHGYLRVEYEVEQMKTGNIPLFYTTANSRHLYADSQIICENYYEDTIEKNILSRLKQLDEEIVDYQIELIEMSIASTVGEKNYICKCDVPENKVIDDLSKVDSFIKKEIEYFKKMRIDLEQNMSTFFLLQSIDKRWKINTLGFDLYQGGSIILLLAYGAKYYKDPNAEAYACRLLNQFNQYYENLNKTIDESLNFSIFTGLGGLIYINYNMYQLYSIEKYLIIVQKIIDDVVLFYLKKNLIQDDLDYMSGLSGLLIIICRIIKNGDYVLNHQLEKLMKKYVLLIKSSKLNIVGVAHGISGVTIALAEIYIVMNEKSYINLIQNLINEEDKLIKRQDVPDIWCRGMSGILYARTFINKVISNYEFHSDTRIDTTDICEFLTIEDASLCHGIYGNIDVIYSLKQLCNTSEYDELIYKSVTASNLSFRFFDSLDYQLKTFMLGSSGIMYVLLRIKYEIPSVLNLELFQRDREKSN